MPNAGVEEKGLDVFMFALMFAFAFAFALITPFDNNDDDDTTPGRAAPARVTLTVDIGAVRVRVEGEEETGILKTFAREARIGERGRVCICILVVSFFFGEVGLDWIGLD